MGLRNPPTMSGSLQEDSRLIALNPVMTTSQTFQEGNTDIILNSTRQISRFSKTSQAPADVLQKVYVPTLSTIKRSNFNGGNILQQNEKCCALARLQIQSSLHPKAEHNNHLDIFYWMYTIYSCLCSLTARFGIDSSTLFLLSFIAK